MQDPNVLRLRMFDSDNMSWLGLANSSDNNNNDNEEEEKKDGQEKKV